MITKNASVLLKTAAGDNKETVTGFAPGIIKKQTVTNIDSPSNGFTYIPLNQYKTKYNYNQLNMPFLANAEKHKQTLNTMYQPKGTVNTDTVANAMTNDPNYANMRRAHYASIPDNEWNKVFEPMAPADRSNMTSVSVPMHANSFISKTLGAAYTNWLWSRGGIHYSPDWEINTVNASPNATINTHWSGNMLGPNITAHTPSTVQHEAIHAEQNAKDWLNTDAENKRLPQFINKKVTGTLPVMDPYTVNTQEHRQATASTNRAVYALSRMLQNANLADKQWAQFDKNKLMHVRDNYKKLPQTREEFITRMKWLSDNPEIALLLGEGARGVSYRKELEMINEGHRRKSDQPDSAWDRKADKPGKVAPILESFDDGWFLSRNRAPRNVKQRSIFSNNPTVTG